MYDASRPLLYVVVAVPALIVGFYALVVVLANPAALWIVVFLGLAVMATRSWLDDDGSRADDRTNCPDCGAPNPADGGTCEYCGESLDRTTDD